MPHATPLSRRQLLRLSASALLARGLWPGALQAADAPDLRFLVLNDLHYTSATCVPFFQRLIAQIKALPEKPAFALVAGDLTDNGTSAQLGAIRDLLKELSLPLHLTIGNHDYDKANTRKAWEEIFPNTLNYTFDYNTWQFLAIDTTDGTKANAAIQPPTLQFLDEALPKLDKKRPTVLLTHFPLGPNVPMRPANAEQVLNRFKDFNLRHVFSGHYHGLTERKLANTILTTNRCCSFRAPNRDGSKQKGFFLCQTAGQTIQRTFVATETENVKT